jgi:antitoxin (DNA-binding transcriptional repressor) of toxin-antitoxin stability system
MRPVAEEKFEAQCLELLEVESGEIIVVTKDGKPHARLAPFEGSEHLIRDVGPPDEPDTVPR